MHLRLNFPNYIVRSRQHQLQRVLWRWCLTHPVFYRGLHSTKSTGWCWAVIWITTLLLVTPNSWAQGEPKPILWFPLVSYSPESRLTAGIFLRFNGSRGERGRPDNITMLAIATQESQRFFLLRSTVYHGSRLETSFGYSNSRSPTRYFGLGNHTKRAVYQELRMDTRHGYEERVFQTRLAFVFVPVLGLAGNTNSAPHSRYSSPQK